MIYLVICYDKTESEQIVVDICRTAEIAEKLKSIYQDRGSPHFEYFVTEVDVNTSSDVFWTIYPDEREKGFSYDEQCS